MKAKSGFTLVEILIVVVILGILAAIVIPQFSNASSEAKLASLKSNLQSIRAQIQLYKIKNDDSSPTVAAFTSQMTTDANNGPFLQSIPTNPYTGTNSVVAWGTGGGAWELDEDGTANPSGEGGAFRAGDAAHQAL